MTLYGLTDESLHDPRQLVLSPAGRAWGIEMILSSYQDRWLEELAREASSEAMAVKAVLQASNSQGYYGWDEQGRSCSYTARRDGILVEAPDGSVGWLSWLDVVRAARAPAAQLTLFDLEVAT